MARMAGWRGSVAALLAGAALVPARPAAAGELSVLPVAVQMTALKSRASVTVLNHGRETVTVQADALSWQREGDVDRHAPAGEMLVNPPVFALAPGQQQVVRLGLRDGTPPAEHERTYRLVLRELPVPAPSDGVSAGVRVLVALRLPVYVAPAQPQRGERWELVQDADGRLHARVTNTGNVHLRLARMRLDAAGLRLDERDLGAVLLAGETRSWPLATTPAAGQTLTLTVQAGHGHSQVALRVPAR